MGIDTVTRDHERALIIALDDCYNRLISYGETAYKFAYIVACSMLDNLPDDGAHTSDRNVVLSRIEKLKPIVDKAEYEKYRALAEEAWQREIEHSEKVLRSRAAESAKEERHRIAEKIALEKNRKKAEEEWEKEKQRYAQIEREQAAESAEQERQRIENEKQKKYRKQAEEAWEQEKKRYADF